MQRDVVLRWIEQIVATVRRMLLGPEAVDPAELETRVDEALEQLLGPLTLLVPRLEPASAATLLQDPERIHGYATLLELKALVLERQQRNDEASALRQRAGALAALGGVPPG